VLPRTLPDSAKRPAEPDEVPAAGTRP